MGMFDGLPMPPDKSYLKDDLSRIDEGWVAARFDSLPHVVQILTSKDREGELHSLREQSEIIEDVVDEIVHAYHGGFNKAIQNYSQILRFFSDSAESIGTLKTDLTDAKKHLGARNKQLHQLWYRSVTLRHIISLLDQIEGISKIPARIEKLVAEKQYYAAVQLQLQSGLMLEREGLQTVGALQDVRSELNKLRSVIFFKVMEDLHAHLYNEGEYSTYNGCDNEALENGGETGLKDNQVQSDQIPPWLSSAAPDEFLEAVKKSDTSVHIKYLQTLGECLCKLGKVAAAGAMICQRLRPTVHGIITSRIKAHAEVLNASSPGIGQTGHSSLTLQYLNGQVESYQLPKHKRKNGVSLSGTLLAVSPVTPAMAPGGAAQAAARELLYSIFDSIARVFENHVIVGELLELKSTQQVDANTPKIGVADASWNAESDGSHITGGYSIGFSLTVMQSECQQLICEILRATPDAASADAAVQTARLAKKNPSKEKRDGSEDGFTFAFRFTDATMSGPNQSADLIRQGWSKKSQGASQEGYGSAAVVPEQGIYLAAAVYRPVLQFTDKVASTLPENHSQPGNDGLLGFVEKFVKDHFLPTMFVDYRKSVQQAISSPAAFRPRAHASASYSSYVTKGRPILQGLLAVDLLAKEVLGWARAMPKFSAELVEYVQTFLERAYERCRTSYMEAVLEKQCYMLVGRHDVDSLMKLDPASSCLPNSNTEENAIDEAADVDTMDVKTQMSDLMLSLRPVKQENLIWDDNKLILLASLSDSLEYVADSIEGVAQIFSSSQVEEKTSTQNPTHRKGASSVPPKDLAIFADDYRKLAVDCLKVLRIEMQLETVFHLQEMTSGEYMDDQDAEEPDDFIISLTAQITRRDEAIAPFVASMKRSYIFGGICSVAENASIKALADMSSINLFGVQQICRNTIALEQALAAIPSINSEAVQLSLDRVRTYFELLNMPFEALLAFIAEHNTLFSAKEYASLIDVHVPGREIPADARDRLTEILPN